MGKKVVLGAGIAGLGAYYADNEVEIYEGSHQPGGLCGGFRVGNFYFDCAVHLSFSKDRMVRSLFNKVSQFIHIPKPCSWFQGMWLRHPVQNNLYPLPAEEKVEAIKGFVQRKGRRGCENFAQWLSDGYGQFLYENIFCPYNKKYWCTDLEDMGVGWIGNRIYQPTLEEVLMGTYTDDTPNTYYAQKMYYPIGGGYFEYLREISESAIRAGKLRLNKKVVRIALKEKEVYFSDGTKVIYEYDELYSSIPLPEMLRMIDYVPAGIMEKAVLLEYTGIVLVSIGLRACKMEKLWFYIYDADIMAARAYMPSVKSSENAPEGCSSIQFEIYFNGRHSKPPEKEEAIRNCLYALERLGVANGKDVLFVDYRIMPYGNVICLKRTEEDLPDIISWLKGVGIVPIGRFGQWEYLWSDQAFLSGYRAAKRRKKG